MKITIIGLGLIGGSLALRLKESGFASEITGVDNNPEHSRQALSLGIADKIADLSSAIKEAELVVVATPVDSAAKIIKKILDLSEEKTVVTDMGSTKVKICEAVKDHRNRNRFVASHPIAGTENFGPEAAFSTLFQGKVGIICDSEKSLPEAVAKVEAMYQEMGMKIIYMDSVAHDLHLAYVSHLSHISSYALGITVLDKEKDEKTIFDLAGSGFASTVRLAKSSPDMWAAICGDNSENLTGALDDYINYLQVFRQHIAAKNYQEIHRLMESSLRIREILQGIKT